MAFLTTPGTFINFDPTQAGRTFTDPDGHTLRYEVQILSPPRGLSLTGSNVIGSLDEGQVVALAVTASDGFGGNATDNFVIAAPAAEPGLPTLPAASFVYEDESLPLPFIFRPTSLGGSVLWDTTPPQNRITNAGATLGRVLFYDKRLSVTNTHSCGSCHRQAAGFAAPESFSVGAQGVPLKRNTLALANVRYNVQRRFFIDGRAEAIEALVLLPIEEPTELANFLPLVRAKLAATSFYPALFEAAFGTNEITDQRISRALAQFVRSMITYRARFDVAYHPMDQQVSPRPDLVLTLQELAGEDVYDRKSCRHCHGAGVHQQSFLSNNGLDIVSADPGDGGTFRSASLRNISVTAPYMHDGRFSTLREVIDHYDHGVQPATQLNLSLRDTSVSPPVPVRMNLTEDEKQALEAFLRTFTDEAFLVDPKFSDPFDR